MTGLVPLPGEEQRPRIQAIQSQASWGGRAGTAHWSLSRACAECVPKRAAVAVQVSLYSRTARKTVPLDT
jgi:hypothetical protein